MQRRLASSYRWVISGLFALLVSQVVLIWPTQLVRPGLSLAEEVETSWNGVDQSMSGMHMVETSDGVQEWELWAEDARSYKAQERIILNAVKAKFFGKDDIIFTVTGRTGEVDTKTKNLKIEGDVHTTSSNGYLFQSQSTHYSSEQRLLTTPDPVEVFGPRDGQGFNLTLRGRGMTADLNTSLVSIHSHVRAEKRVEEGRTAYIRSESAVVSGADNRARFLGRVVLDLDDMRVTGPSAEFQYDAQLDLVRSILVEGGARVSDSEKWATSHNVLMDFASDTLTMRGSPKVVQGGDELYGEEIVFLDKGQRVQVKGAKAKVQNMERGAL